MNLLHVLNTLDLEGVVLGLEGEDLCGVTQGIIWYLMYK